MLRLLHILNCLCLEVKDSTFPEVGQIDLWTKADAWTYFENLMLNDT